MPNTALTAAHVTTTVSSVCGRPPVTKRYISGTSRNSTSCLQSIKLVRGSGDSAAETSVAPPYATSGQKKVGAAKRSRLPIIRAIQQTSATASRICAAAIENCTAPAMPKSASAPACSSPRRSAECDASSAMESFTWSILTGLSHWTEGRPEGRPLRLGLVAGRVLFSTAAPLVDWRRKHWRELNADFSTGRPSGRPVRLPRAGALECAPACTHDLRRGDRGQAAEIARRTDALIA